MPDDERGICSAAKIEKERERTKSERGQLEFHDSSRYSRIAPVFNSILKPIVLNSLSYTKIQDVFQYHLKCIHNTLPSFRRFLRDDDFSTRTIALVSSSFIERCL